MFINITASETGNNKGSSSALVQYLEKENKNKNRRDHELWFNGNSTCIHPFEVRTAIDGNVAKLGREEAKFFLINLSPSSKELKHLGELYGEEGVKEQLKSFAESIMDEYARNFKRTGIDSAKDLLWFAKVENDRYYRYSDKAVREGTRKAGDRKEGMQMHVQIIVSRKDITNRIKLSPQNTSRGSNAEHSAKLGQFDRKAFKGSGERLFDGMFSFERDVRDSVNFLTTMKNGTFADKINSVACLQESFTFSSSHNALAHDHMFDLFDHYITFIGRGGAAGDQEEEKRKRRRGRY